MPEINDSADNTVELSQDASCSLSLVPYGSVSGGDIYFSERLNTSKWTTASTTDKKKALIQATRTIDNLSFKGSRANSGQKRQFPRGEDTEIPDPIKYACYEIALSLLSGKDLEQEHEASRIARDKYYEVETTYNSLRPPNHVLHGIISYTAWLYLVPYLRDPSVVTISRV